MSDRDEMGVIAPGSSSVKLTEREDQIASLLALGYSHKRIAAKIGISPGGVGAHVSNIASRIPGNASPSVKVTVWYLEHRT